MTCAVDLPAKSPLSLLFLPSHLFPLYITETHHPRRCPRFLPLLALSLFILHTSIPLPFSLPLAAISFPPAPPPLSAVPVGLWPGRVWAPAAFSKASAAAPATDPSNTATLTSVYTYTFF